jgi:hypothetical protein
LPPTEPPVGAPVCEGLDGQMLITIKLTTDDQAEDTFWAVYRSVDKLRVMIGIGLSSNWEYETSRCLPSGCYEFIIIDDVSDGFYGTYSVLVDNQEVASGGSFQVSNVVNFCAETATQNSVATLQQTSNECVDTTLLLHTDGYPDETVVRLFNAATGEDLWPTNVWQTNTQYELKACIDPSGCFVFELEDLGGDGGATYKLLYNKEEVSQGTQQETVIHHTLGSCHEKS